MAAAGECIHRGCKVSSRASKLNGILNTAAKLNTRAPPPPQHHLQGNSEVFLMLFYSWVCYTNLSECTQQAWLPLYANCCPSEPVQEGRVNTENELWCSALHFEQRLLSMHYSGGGGVVHGSAFNASWNFWMCYFKAGFDIRKIRSQNGLYDITEPYRVLICLLRNYQTLHGGSDFLKNAEYLNA